MAIGRGGILGQQNESGYLTDESDFYGDETVKQDLEAQVESFNTSEWWENKPPTLEEMARENMKADAKKKTAILYNPYAGQACARQLDETIEEFLQRLPPQSTPVSYSLPWIFIANPYRKAPKTEESQQETEGPPEEDRDLPQFLRVAVRLLEELTHIRHEIEKKKAGKPKGTITRAFNLEKDTIVKKVLETATELHCTSGKWMMFCDSTEINAVWAVVARATAENELGIAAKVAPDEGDPRKERLVCIYTYDFNDMEDVSRVIKKMRDLGLVDSRGKPLYYKCDAYTHLGINSKNEWEIKASLYSSADMLKAKDDKKDKKDKKIDGFFYKKKDTGNWQELEE